MNQHTEEPQPILMSFEGTGAGEMFDALLTEAVARDGSDVFLARTATGARLSIRHMGLVKPVAEINEEEALRLTNFIKTGCNIDLGERRRPHEGRWLYTLNDDCDLELRVSTLPTLYGEDVAIRVLQRSSPLRNLDHLGLNQKQYNELMLWLNSPGGLILVTGPTGSGKTTTLYACLNYLRQTPKKINTIEDPVEYALDGIHQSQTNERIGLDFAELLRSTLRQGPDVIMIGEVRDTATARTMIRAANSGHLVFATTHAPTAAGAIQSLRSLDVSPAFLASSLLGTISQRLVRKLDQSCKVPVELGEDNYAFWPIKHLLKPGEGHTIYSPGESPEHPGSDGYLGRTGCFEVLTVTREIRRLIADGRPTREIHDAAVRGGMVPFQHSSLLMVAEGLTTIEEILRVVPPESLGLDD